MIRGKSILVASIAALTLTTTAYAEDVKVLIGFHGKPGRAERALIARLGGKIDRNLGGLPVLSATVPSRAVKSLRRHPEVTSVDLEGYVFAADAEEDAVFGVSQIGADRVHARGNQGGGINVAVLDTGIDASHPELDDSFVDGIDFANNDTDPNDDDGHGTHVCGTIAAEDNGTGIVGVAPAVNLFALKVLGADGGGSFSDILAALEWSRGRQVRGVTGVLQDVINLSLGTSQDPGSTVRNAFDAAAADGVIIVSSAGNEGAGTNTVGFPAQYDSVIAVAATDSSNRRGSFSSTGPKVEISAPGVNIVSTRNGGGFVSFNGTSMASPHVAAVCALVLAAGHSADDVRGRLQATATDLGSVGRDNEFGFGLVNADLAAASLAPPPPVNEAPVVAITAPGDSTAFQSNETISFAGSAQDPEDGDLGATLTWTSDLDGAIGTGASFSANLTAGAHTITAVTSDEGGLTASATVTVTVTDPPPPAVLTVDTFTDKLNYRSGERVLITILVTDGTQGIAGAPVRVDLTTANGRRLRGFANVDANGVIRFAFRPSVSTFGSGTYFVQGTSTDGVDLESDTSSFTVR